MKKIFRNFFLFAFILPFLLMSCEPDKGKNSVVKAARINIQISGHHDEQGFLIPKIWDAGDKVAAFCAGDNQITVSAPISTGGDKSMFSFSLNGLSDGRDIIMYWPANAKVTPDGSGAIVNIPAVQNGKFSEKPLRIGCTTFKETSYKGIDAKLNTLPCTFIANVQMGPYSIKKAVLKSNSGEKLSGTIHVNPKTMECKGSENSVTIEFAEALDCRNGAIKIAMLCCPTILQDGYTVTFTTDKGEEFSIVSNEKTELKAGTLFNTGGASDSKATELIICGDNKIYIIDAKMAMNKGWKNAIVWEWDAKSVATEMGKNEGDMIRLDECKPVEDKKQILATSSKAYAVLIDKETKKLLWFSTNSPNAHSAELLPGGRIAVACSGNNGCVQIFDASTPDRELFRTPLESAHGVIWNSVTQRLYAIGGTSLNIYKLANWESGQPKLELERTVGTKSHVGGLHDLSFVDANTLLLAGAKAALYTIGQDSFESLNLFNSSTGLKSVNYNKSTGECWYTDATTPEGEFPWSTQTIHYNSNPDGIESGKTIKIDGLNMYKVRVLNW